MSIKAVVFDIDGTLYPNYQMYLCSIPAALGHPRLVYHFGKVRAEIRKQDYQGSFRDFQAELLGRHLKVSKEKAGQAVEDHLYQSWAKSFKKVKTFPYVKTMLDCFKQKGIKMGVLSDFPVFPKIGYLGLDGYWDSAFTSEDTGYLKPHKAPFERLIHELQVEPDEILYVGNSYRYDVLGARAVGMKTAHITKKAVKNSVADFSFFDYRDLQRYVEERL